MHELDAATYYRCVRCRMVSREVTPAELRRIASNREAELRLRTCYYCHAAPTNWVPTDASTVPSGATIGACLLVESFDQVPDLNADVVAAAWLVESQMRLASFDAGAVELDDAAEVQARARALLSSAKCRAR